MTSPTQKLTLSYYAAFVEKLRRLYGEDAFVDISIRGIDKNEFEIMKRMNEAEADSVVICSKTLTGDIEFRTEHHVDSPKGILKHLENK